MSGEILGFKYQVWDTEHDGSLEGLRNHCWSYIFHPPVGIMTQTSGEEGVAMLSLRCRTRQSSADFGQMSRYPEALWPIFFPLTPLLWLMKASITNVAA